MRATSVVSGYAHRVASVVLIPHVEQGLRRALASCQKTRLPTCMSASGQSQIHSSEPLWKPRQRNTKGAEGIRYQWWLIVPLKRGLDRRELVVVY